MKFSTKATVGAALLSTAAVAQDSLCDKYTKALFTNNTAENQYTLLVKVVNTALIGNYTPGAKNVVSGILVPGEVNGKQVNLLPYFNGGFISTNSGGKASSVNFIDDGGAIALAADKPATGTSSKQYVLISGLYSYFGGLLGCSQYNSTGFPAYTGTNRMYELHKFMNIDINELTYFVTQVGAAATSFGVTAEDIAPVGKTLLSIFGERCAPAQVVIPAQPADLQAICINSDCPEETAGPVCSSYNKRNGVGVEPATATSTPGPALSALAAQLSTIGASVASASAAALTTGTTTISSGSSAETTSTYTTTRAGGAAGGGSGGSVSTGTTTETSGSSTFTSTFTTTGAAGGAGGASGSVVSTGTTTETSGSSTITSTFTTTRAGSAATSTSSKAAAGQFKVQGGILAVAGMAAAVIY